jgi:hypothetical protein
VKETISKVPVLAYVMLLAVCPIVTILVQEMVKTLDAKAFERFQKRSKLEFNTKLGMHSPV